MYETFMVRRTAALESCIRLDDLFDGLTLVPAFAFPRTIVDSAGGFAAICVRVR